MPCATGTAVAADAGARNSTDDGDKGDEDGNADEAAGAEGQIKHHSTARRRWGKRGKNGTIKANSIPLSSVLVDGRPAGRTPASIKVPVGSHTVMFVHPELGRKKVKVKVKANREAVAAVRFKQ